MCGHGVMAFHFECFGEVWPGACSLLHQRLAGVKEECQPVPSQVSCKYSSSFLFESSFDYTDSDGALCPAQAARCACLKEFSSNINAPQEAQSRLSACVAACRINTFLRTPFSRGVFQQEEHTHGMWRQEGLSEQGHVLTVVQPLRCYGVPALKELFFSYMASPIVY